MLRAWREKMKRQGITILTPEHAAQREIFEQRQAAARLRARFSPNG